MGVGIARCRNYRLKNQNTLTTQNRPLLTWKNAFFDFATDFYYKNKVAEVKKLLPSPTAILESFKELYKKPLGLLLKQKTEKALNKAMVLKRLVIC